jgi:hypothetical protein
MMAKQQGWRCPVAEMHAPVIQFARRVGLTGLIDEGRSFPTVDAAVRAAERLVAKE